MSPEGSMSPEGGKFNPENKTLETQQVFTIENKSLQIDVRQDSQIKP